MNSEREKSIQAKILVIDQTKDQESLLAQFLSKQGYQVLYASSDTEALTIISSDPPDLILLNTAIGDMDAYSFCQELKTVAKIRSTPVIFLNSQPRRLDIRKVFQVGGADYLNYPWQAEEVLVRIIQQINLRNLQRKLRLHSTRLNQEIQKRQALEEKLANLEQSSTTDTLTQIANRQYFEQYLAREWQQSARVRISLGDISQTALSLIFCEVDYFQAYRENYGQQASDDCLKTIAEDIGNSLKRTADLVALYQEGQFAIALPHTDEKGAMQVAKNIRDSVAILEITHAYSPLGDYVTLSFGIATGIPTQALSTDVLVTTAARSLAQAQEQGGNQIVTDSFEQLQAE